MFFRQTHLRCLVALLRLLAYAPAAHGETQEEKKEQSQSQQPNKPGDLPPEQDQAAGGITAVPNRPTFATTAEAVHRAEGHVRHAGVGLGLAERELERLRTIDARLLASAPLVRPR